MHNRRVAEEHLRSIPRAFSRMLGIVLVLMLIFVSSGMAAEVSCDNNLSKPAVNRLSKDQKRQIQGYLHEIFKQDPEYIQANDLYAKHNAAGRGPLTDGKIGPITLHWLQKFCTDYSLDTTYLEAGASFVRNVTDALAHFAAITRSHPKWKAILSSDQFQHWIDDQSELRKVEIYNVMRSGTAPLIISLLNQFQNQQPQIPTSGDEGEGLISYQLTQEAIDDLLGDQDIVKQLSEIVDKPYPSRNALWQAVEEKIIGVTKHASMYQDLIKQRAEMQSSLRLTDKSFETLKLDSTPDNILEPLRKLKDLPFKDVQHLQMAIILRFEQINDSSDKQGMEPISESGTQDATLREDVQIIQKAAQELKRLRDRVDNYPIEDLTAINETDLNDILYTAEPKTTFSLTKQSLDEIKTSVNDQDIPPGVAKMLKSTAGIEYANRALFESALAANAGQSRDYLRYLPKLIDLARRDHKDYEPADIIWDGGLCGCVLDDLSGEVYGFYPYWLADGKKQTLSFDVFTRIGYYAVSFDGKGKIVEPHNWSNEKGRFLNEARLHRTDVDLVVYKKWSTFLEEYKRNNTIVESAAKSIVDMVNEELTQGIFNVAKPFLSLGNSSIPSMGDGITLYLDENPLRGSESGKLFEKFIKKLRAEIKDQKHRLKLNVIVPMETFGKPDTNTQYLTRLIPEVSENDEENFKAQDYVDLFIVFLTEPTTQAKKKLRQTVENLFVDSGAGPAIRGIQRRNLLRKLVPVITYHPNNLDKDQLEADLTYSEDNFAGIGFWPIPVDKPKAEGGVNLAEMLKEDYTRSGGLRSVQSTTSMLKFFQYVKPVFDKPLSLVKKFVCQYRWPFRLLFDLLVIAVVIYVYLYYFKCFRRCFRCLLGLIALLAVVFLLRLFFDPFYSEMAQGNALLILLIVGILGYAIYRYNDKQQQFP